MTYKLNSLDINRAEGDNIWLTTIIGDKETQEDCIQFGTLAGFVELTEQEIIDVLWQAFKQLQGQIEENNLRDGSTAALAISCRGKIYTVICGDSEVVLASQGNPHLEKLYKNLHNLQDMRQSMDPAVQVEYKRLAIDESLFIRTEQRELRLQSGLNMGRSMGDVAHARQSRLSHQIDIFIYELPKQASQQHFILVKSDGVFHRSAITQEMHNVMHGSILEKNRVFTFKDYQHLFEHKAFQNTFRHDKAYSARVAQFAFNVQNVLLTQQSTGVLLTAQLLCVIPMAVAYAFNSHDNCSAIALAVDPTQQEAQFVSVFDGHGGPATALYLQRHMQEVMTKQIRLKKLERQYGALFKRHYKQGRLSEQKFDEFYSLFLTLHDHFYSFQEPIFSALKQRVSNLYHLKLTPSGFDHTYNEYKAMKKFLLNLKNKLQQLEMICTQYECIPAPPVGRISPQLQAVIDSIKNKQFRKKVMAYLADTLWLKANNEVIQEAEQELLLAYISYLPTLEHQGDSEKKMWLESLIPQVIKAEAPLTNPIAIIRYALNNYVNALTRRSGLDAQKVKDYFYYCVKTREKITALRSNVYLTDTLTQLERKFTTYEGRFPTPNNLDTLLEKATRIYGKLKTYKTAVRLQTSLDQLLDIAPAELKDRLRNALPAIVKEKFNLATCLNFKKIEEELDQQYKSMLKAGLHALCAEYVKEYANTRTPAKFPKTLFGYRALMSERNLQLTQAIITLFKKVFGKTYVDNLRNEVLASKRISGQYANDNNCILLYIRKNCPHVAYEVRNAPQTNANVEKLRTRLGWNHMQLV